MNIPAPNLSAPRARRVFALRKLASPNWVLLVGALFALFLGPGCAGSGVAEEGSGTPTRVLLRDYRTGLELELVNDAYDDRVTYYSSSRNLGETGRKFTEDEMLDGLLAVLDDQGWAGYAQQGSAPRDGARVISSAIELERNGQTTHWKIGDGSERDMRQAFVNCKQVFVVLYQQTPGFQAIENNDGSFDFEGPTRGASFR